MTAIPMALYSYGTDGKILYGTPSVDGLADLLYFQSLEVPLDTVGEECEITQGTTYLLWNNNYIYFCAVSYENPTENSAVCFCIRDDDKCQTIVVSADGQLLACTEGSDCTFRIDSCKFKAKTFDDYYVVEAAIAFDSISAGKKIGFSTLYFDDYSKYTYSMGGHFLFNEFELSEEAAQNIVPDVTQGNDTSQVVTSTETNQPGLSSTESDTGKQTGNDTQTASGTEQQNESKAGCGSVAGSLAVLVLLPAATVGIAKCKKKH